MDFSIRFHGSGHHLLLPTNAATLNSAASAFSGNQFGREQITPNKRYSQVSNKSTARNKSTATQNLICGTIEVT